MAGACNETELQTNCHCTPACLTVLRVFLSLPLRDNNIHHLGFVFFKGISASMRKGDPSCDVCCSDSTLHQCR